MVVPPPPCFAKKSSESVENKQSEATKERQERKRARKERLEEQKLEVGESRLDAGEVAKRVRMVLRRSCTILLYDYIQVK